MDTLERLQAIFRDVFDDEEVELYAEMSAANYDEWDSLAHVQLIVAVENQFNVKFTTGEVLQLKNVGDFVALIDSKTVS